MFNSKNHKGRLMSHLVIYLSRTSSRFFHMGAHTLFGRSTERFARSNQTWPTPSHTKTRTLPAMGTLLFATLLTACGIEQNELDSDLTALSIDRTLTGTVAVGKPVKGDVIIIDADGEKLDTQSDTTGTYAVNLGGRPGPYLIRFEPDDSTFPALYSYATNAGVTNITPFTTLALFLAYEGDFADSFDDWAEIHANWKLTALEQARAKINANFVTELQNSGADPVVYDFFTVPFKADQTGIDAFLDNYNVSFDYGANDYTITDTSGQPVPFNENIDTTNYYIGARFIPEDAANWKLTWTPVIDGQQGRTVVSYPGNNIPWSEERFNEIFWDKLASTPTQITMCEESPNVSCEFRVQVTKLNTSYDVIGNGEIGTIVKGSGTHNWNMRGWFQPNGQQRINIDKSVSWSFSWSWERIN